MKKVRFKIYPLYNNSPLLPSINDILEIQLPVAENPGSNVNTPSVLYKFLIAIRKKKKAEASPGCFLTPAKFYVYLLFL